MENLMASWALDVHGSRNYMFRKHQLNEQQWAETAGHGSRA